MRFIHTADWHIAAGKAYIPNAVDRTLAAIDEVYAAAAKHNVNTVVQAGDVFDSPSVTDHEKWLFAHKLLSYDEAGFRTLIIPGNHDEIDQELSALSYLALLTEQKRFKHTVVANKTRLVKVDDTGFLLFAQEPWSCLEKHVQVITEGSLDLGLKHLVVVAHTTMIGAKTPLGFKLPHGVEFKMDSRITYNAYGDIHMFQRVGPRSFYSGPPLQIDFGENVPTGALLVDLDNPDEPQFLELPSIRLVTISEAHEETPENSYARIIYDERPTVEETMPANVIKRVHKTEQVDLSDIQTDNSLFSGIDQVLEKRGLDEEDRELADKELREAIIRVGR